MLQHIALTVNDIEEIKNFYEEVLFFSMKHKFSVNENITRKIFKTGEAVDVYVMCHNNTELEIFRSARKELKVFSHICLAYRKSKIIYTKAVKLGYKTLVKKNPSYNTYFIWDKSGNMFEIKEIPE